MADSIVKEKDGTYTLAGGAQSSPTDVDDYNKPEHNWKWILAALTGAAAVNNSPGNATLAAESRALISAESLRHAGRTFDQAQSVLLGVGQNLREQAKGLAGPGERGRAPPPRRSSTRSPTSRTRSSSRPVASTTPRPVWS